MYIGSALFLVAVGAILRWAVSWQVSGFDIQLAGLIIFLVGILGLIITLILWYTRRSSQGRRRDDAIPPRNYRPDDSAPRDYRPDDSAPRP
jgi:uncharacterized membrane protein YedE/YeeE